MWARLVTMIITLVAAQAPSVAQAQGEYRRILQIGVESGLEEYTFGAVGDVAIGVDGTIYVLDTMNRVVRAYDPTGHYLRRFGRQGEGPGEFRFPTRVIATGESLLVLDPAQQRSVRFDYAGRHMETRRLPGAEFGLDMVVPMRHRWQVGARTSTAWTNINSFMDASPAEFRRRSKEAREGTFKHVAVFRDDSRSVDTVFRFDDGIVQYLMPGRGYGILRHFSWGPGGGWVTAGDSMLALVDGFTGSIRILKIAPNGFQVLRSSRLAVEPIPLGLQDWEAAAAHERTKRHLAENILLIGPSFKTQLGEPIFADDGSLWVKRISDNQAATARGRLDRYLVVPLDGRAQHHVDVPAGFSLKAVRGDLIAGVRRSDVGVHVVEVWQARLN